MARLRLSRSHSGLFIAYLLLSLVWIALSDQFLSLWVVDAAELTAWQTLKGWVFVAVTGLLLYLLLRWQERETVSLAGQIERFGQTFGRVPLGVAYVDGDGRWLEVNDSLCRMLGLSGQELKQQNFPNIAAPHGGMQAESLHRLLAGEEETWSHEVEYVRADRRVVALRITATLVRNRRHGQDYVIAFFEDLSLQRSTEARLRDHLENSPLAVLELDRDLRVSYWSPQAEANFGWSAAEVLGRKWVEWRFIHDDDRERVEDTIADLVSHRSSHIVIHNRNYTRSGEVRECVWYNSILTDERGDVQSILGQGQDITQREQALRDLTETKSLLEKTFASLHEAVFVVEPGSRTIVTCNAAVEEIFGYRPEELVGQGTEILHVDREHYERFARDYDAVLANAGTVQLEYQMRRRDGRVFDSENTVTMIHPDEGLAHTKVVSVVRDITARKQAAEQQRLTAMVFDNANEAIVIGDRERCIVYTNPAFQRMTGYATEEVQGRQAMFLDAGNYDEKFYRTMWETVDSQGHWQGEIFNRRRNGQTYPAWLSLGVVKDHDGKVVNYIGIATDLSEQRRLDERVRYLSIHDSLTGLLNREALAEHLGQAIAHSGRVRRSVAVLAINIDRFKMINDSLGHAMGDKLLKQVAERLQAVIRNGDSVARLAADQFVLVLAELAAPEDVSLVLEKISAGVARPQMIDGQELHVSFSMGVALYPRDGQDSAELVRNADVAMNRARVEGGGRYRFFTRQMHDQAMQRLTMETELRRALERGELAVWYQPQITVTGEKIVGAEALLRWKSPRYGQVSPAQFIPIAEASGLILPIGRWVLEQVAAQVRRWQQAGLLNGSVAVNLSARQFREAHLVESIRRVLDKEGLAAPSLELELTESVIMDNVAQAARILQELKEMGLRLSLDDFGTGYSSLSYLKRFPFDTLKIDRAFVRDITTDADDAAIADSIIALAHTMGMSVVAEGVETAEQLAHLRRRGCDLAQGYYCSPAIPPADFEALVRGNRQSRVASTESHLG